MGVTLYSSPASFSTVKVRSELENRIEKLNQGRSNTEAWLKAVRHDLATERAKRENTEERLATVTNDARVRRKIRLQASSKSVVRELRALYFLSDDCAACRAAVSQGNSFHVLVPATAVVTRGEPILCSGAAAWLSCPNALSRKGVTPYSPRSLTVHTTGLVSKSSKRIARGENARLAPGALVSGFARQGDKLWCALIKKYRGGFSVCGEPDDDHGGRMLHICCHGALRILTCP